MLSYSDKMKYKSASPWIVDFSVFVVVHDNHLSLVESIRLLHCGERGFGALMQVEHSAQRLQPYQPTAVGY